MSELLTLHKRLEIRSDMIFLKIVRESSEVCKQICVILNYFNNPSKSVRESLDFDKQNREIIDVSMAHQNRIAGAHVLPFTVAT